MKSLTTYLHNLVNEKLHVFFLSPVMFFYILIVIGPAVWVFYLGMTDWSGVAPREVNFIGLENFIALASDTRFWSSLIKNLVFLGVFVSSTLCVSLFVAVVLNSGPRFAAFFRTILVAPMSTSIVAAGILATFFFTPKMGIANNILALMGLEGFRNFDFLGSFWCALYIIVATDVWLLFGFCSLLVIAGLSAIEESLYDAARVDGAGPLRLFFSITLPLLRETLAALTVFLIITAFRVFPLVWVMTQGGPFRATEFLGVYLYKKGFFALQLGYASAIAVCFLGICFVFAFTNLRLFRAGTTQT